MTLVDRIASAAASGAVSGLEKNLDSIIRTVMNSLFDHPWYPFIAGAQMCLMEHGMLPKEAWERGREVCKNYVKDEKLAFGDAGYEWGWRGGYDVALECEVAYWDDSK